MRAFLFYCFVFFCLMCPPLYRAQNSGEQHRVETCTDKQDDTKVGAENCTNKRLRYENVLLPFSLVLHILSNFDHKPSQKVKC